MRTNIAVILTALEDEFIAVRSHLQDLSEVRHSQGTRYESGVFSTRIERWTVAVVQTGAKNVNAGIEAERAINHFKPTHAFFVGIAGGIKDVSLGDVVAGTKAYGYQSGKAVEDFKPRPDVGESSYELVQGAMRVARDKLWQPRIKISPGTAPRAFVAPIAAGDAVVASTKSDTYKFIRQNYGDALAVNMEDYGMLRAGYMNPQVRCLVVRGISDLIDKKEEADSEGSQPIAAAHAAAFAFEVIAGINTSGEKTDEPIAGPTSNSWNQLEGIVTDLYPMGPNDAEIWSRAGGDVALLDLKLSGRASWHSALKKLRQGGGGINITIKTLVSAIAGDFPKSEPVKSLARMII